MLNCTACGAALGAGTLAVAGPVPCPSCRSPLTIAIFPALAHRIGAGSAGDLLTAEGEAVCFNHPDRRAAVPCASCGRFLCSLCDLEFDGQHLCPSCLESGARSGRFRKLQNQRVLYDRLALILAVVPIITFYFTLITAPAAIVVAVRYWKAPGSLVAGTKVRLVLAILIALPQILGWGMLFYYLARGLPRAAA
jgi:hypothetical protein